MDSKKLNRLIIMGLMVALSFVGANIKLPGPFTTIAFDSLPAFFAGMLLGGTSGGAVGFLGHLMTSFLSGFPLGVHTHIIIAVMMFLTVMIFGTVTKKMNVYIGAVLAIILNGVAMPLTLIVLPTFSIQMAVGFMPMLTSVSVANVVVSVGVYNALSKTDFVQGFRNDGL